jgi:futalosine hydrolase
MQVLLTAATPFEIAPTIGWLEQHFESTMPGRFTRDVMVVQLCITGVGMVATSWQMARHLAQFKPDLAIQAGIAGALDPAFKLGDVYYVASEIFADLGVEEASGSVSDLFEIGLLQVDTPPFTAKKLLNPAAEAAKFLPHAQGISVNKVHGAALSIAQLRSRYPEAQVESMEGAAFFYGCLLEGIAFMEIRSISNYVEPRNREAWNIPLAIEALNAVLIPVLSV